MKWVDGLIKLLKENNKKNIQEYIEELNYVKNGLGTVDIHITNHCNLNCKGCDHFAPLADEWFANIEDFTRLLRRLKQILKNKPFYGISLMGGEPLLHPDVMSYVRKTRESFPDIVVKLITNGTIEKSNDFYDELKTYNVELSVTNYYEGKHFYRVNLGKTNDNDIICNNRNSDLNKIKENVDENMYEFFNVMPCCQLNMNGDFYSCIIPANIDKFNSFFNENYAVKKNDDFINIFEIDSIDEIIKMNNRKSINFCKYCNKKTIVDWGISCKDRKEWELEEDS